ncbi:toxin [Streptomyces roseochromogenus]|nr:toxin [Streptomyces roseochromogenus]
METGLDLTRAQWRKSSYSSTNGGECIECAPLGHVTWVKASRSGNTGGDCVEVSSQPCRVAVRDSKDPGGPMFTVGRDAFAAFVGAL